MAHISLLRGWGRISRSPSFLFSRIISFVMPRLRKHIEYSLHDLMVYQGSMIKHVLKSTLVLVLVALMLETFLFNINYFRTSGYHTTNLDNRLTLTKTIDDQYRVTEVNHTIEFTNLNAEVHNLWLNFDYRQPAQQLTVKIQFTDEAHQTYFDTTEYTIGVPDVEVNTLCDESEFINLNTTGLVKNLKITISGDDVTYPVLLSDVAINAREPFIFNKTRFLLTLGVLALIYIFRPRSAVYRIKIVSNPVKSRAAIITAVAIEAVLLSSYFFMGSNMVGIATSSYNSGSWDGVSLVNSYQVGGKNSQQYAELARAMAKGQLYLDAQPPEWLQEMEDPYDKGARDELQKETGEEYLFDVAYHDGHYYVYFGVVPVLLFYLPCYLITGADFPTAMGVLFAVLMFILGCSALLDRFSRYHFKRVSLGLYLLLQIPLVMCCGILYLLKFPTFYSLPISLALAFSVWGLYLWMRGRASGKPCGWYLGGSLCMAMVAGCRPQLLVLSLVAFPLFWRAYITKRKILTSRGAIEFACLIAPYIVIAAGLMLYNHARFGSFTDFGANYNLTVNDMTKRGWNIGRLAPALFSYFLQMPTVTGVFPFLQAAEFDTTYLGQTIKEVTFGGILVCLPVLWVLPFAKRILELRFRTRSTRTIAGVIIALLFGGVVLAIVDAEMAGILQRYYADFSFMFLTAAVLLIFIVNENLKNGTTTHELLMKVLLGAVTVSVVYSWLVCFIPETGWFSDIYPWSYQDIIEAVQFWT